MSWFTKYIEHPFVAAIADLTKNPAIAANPDAAKAVADAKAGAEAVASVAGTAAATTINAAQTAADPAIAGLANGLTAAADAYLLQALGPVGQLVAGPAANTIIALGAAQAHTIVDALFAHALAQLPKTA